ncbi:sarcosine oxidase subunit alpha family protein [Pseudahrensia aquimaris]|uniref:Sarcosine oxidase subunit alpha family protein n=1 Tax=Pseudahrensia aquimaris TaxID=744461 RepID=A0ABW3FG00_9HYPH
MSGFRITNRQDIGTALSPETVTFTFDGKLYEARKGDTLAAALIANGVSVVGRSFKYHRPRGVFSAGSEEPSALVTLGAGARREPNIRATEVEVFDGLTASSQNAWPSPKFDLLAINQLAGKALSAGFYYKTFMGPQVAGNRTTNFWYLCEQFIRRAAGLGRGAAEADPDHYGRMNAWCDVLVVGSGAAGLAAAEKAALSGARVILAEQQPRLGGALLSAPDFIDGNRAHLWAASKIAALEAMNNVTLLPRTTVQSHFDDNQFLAIERCDAPDAEPNLYRPRQRAWMIRAKSAVIATGALERPMVFPGNDRPGVMLADAARRYTLEHAVAPGQNVCVFTNNDSGWLAARDMAKAGVVIAAIIDVRADVSEATRAAGEDTNAKLHTGAAVVSTGGWQTLSSIKVSAFNELSGEIGEAIATYGTDCLAVSGGWSPVLHLTSQQGGKPLWDSEIQAFLPGEPTQRWHGAGAMTGRMGLEAAFDSGAMAAIKALEDCGIAPEDIDTPNIDGDAIDFAPSPVLEIAAKGKSFVDLQHDVTADDVRLAHREGFVSVEHLKRYTTLGMATDQGKTSNMAGLAIMAQAQGVSIPEVGTTRFRPPYTPTAIGAIAGELYGHLKPERLTPMHDWHVANGAGMVPNGLWLRPESYNRAGETVEQAYIREAKAVRASVGIVDVSTLGKIDIQGPDASEFLNRVYSNAFAKLPVGKARYGLMLREDGFLFDDGTTWRLSENQFLMTTTTAGAGHVMEHLEMHLDRYWPDLKVHLTSVTDQWAGVALAGPKARDVLRACTSNCDVSDEGIPFMGVREAVIDEIPVLIARLSFSGELAYEVYCGATYGAVLWDALMKAGEEYFITPYGLEALTTLRVEKGHIAGPEINGRTTAGDVGLGGMVSKKKNFIGNVLSQREAMNEEGRLQLVAIRSLDGARIRGGSHLVQGSKDDPGPSEGHTTTTCFSPVLNAYVALALLENGKNRHGETMFASNPVRDRHVAVEVLSPHMYDPDGGKMHG